MKMFEIVLPGVDRKVNEKLDNELKELEKLMQEDFEKFLKEEDDEQHSTDD